MNKDYQGIGMTSQRARNRLVEQLQDMGVKSDVVLDAIRTTPRHIFVDEALASRAYDNTALPLDATRLFRNPILLHV